MTNDLISRSELLLEMAAGCVPLDEKGISGVTGDESTIYDYIKNAPAVDAAPVVHGRWIDDMYFDEPVTRCTWCNHGFAKGHKAKRFPYCPNCGARMDQEADNAQE